MACHIPNNDIENREYGGGDHSCNFVWKIHKSEISDHVIKQPILESRNAYIKLQQHPPGIEPLAASVRPSELAQCGMKRCTLHLPMVSLLNPLRPGVARPWPSRSTPVVSVADFNSRFLEMSSVLE
jgi:hypothetical protein